MAGLTVTVEHALYLSRCFDSLLNPISAPDDSIIFNAEFQSYWETVMFLPIDFQELASFSSELTQTSNGCKSLLFPTTLEELNKCFPRNSTALAQKTPL
ncbi:hypothetical protein AVEN_30700-1 [Araneus ventricosus]|uniref:Uncharacterized protein n=1 Tax=Araneus ventricosus TaxID=182803 RepID=A0A4Y2IZ22_ARAVE|nr:hypothetical protein AVEN_30700-1 [Araneus ventricosus]